VVLPKEGLTPVDFNAIVRAHLIAEAATTALVGTNKNSRAIAGLVELLSRFKTFPGAELNTKSAPFAVIRVNGYRIHGNNCTSLSGESQMPRE
jgi:hypothetical protein